MKDLIKLWIFVAFVLTLTSCSINKRIAKCKDLIVQVTDTVTNYETETITVYESMDIPYYIPADTSAWVQALIECDSLGKATIKELTSQKGIRSTVTAQIKDNVLTAKSNCEAITDSLQTIIKNVTKSTVATNTIVRPCPENKLSWWERIKLNYGGWAIIGWVLLVLFFIGRKFLKAWIKANVPLSGISRWL